MSTTHIESLAEVVEVDNLGARLRVGALGHQHRILFDVPEEHRAAFASAREAGLRVRVLIEVPKIGAAP